MRFHIDSEDILRSATKLALRLNAPAVEVEHLLLCDPESDGEPVEIREIPFGAKTLEVLKAAAELVHREDSVIIRPRHLQLVLSSSTGLSPEWGAQRQRPMMTDLLDRAITSTLEYKGVDVQSLHRQLHGLTVRECRPGPEFIDTKAGRRDSKLAAKMSTKQDAGLLLLLLSYLLCEGRAAAPFRQAGLTEKLIVDLLEEHPEELRRPPTFTFDFSLLGVEAGRLDFDARLAVELAWTLREGPELRGHDLLRGLVAASNPLQELNVQLLLIKIAGYDFMDTFFHDQHFAPSQSEVQLAEEIPRIFRAAVREAGPGGSIGSFRLLIGLAEVGNELLASKGVTPEKIRRQLGDL